MWEDKLLLLPLLVLAGLAMASGLAPTKPQLFANPTYACALRSTGHVDCWGLGPTGASVAAPTNKQFWSISSGVSFTCALAYDGHVQCWGENAPYYSSPAQSVLVRDDTMCVRTDDLTFECPGMFAGEGSSLSLLAFRGNWMCAVGAGSGYICWDRNYPWMPAYLYWQPAQLVMGDSWICGVQQSTGTIQCLTTNIRMDEWGNVEATGDTTPLQAPVGAFLPGTLVSNGDDFCALRVDNTAACWGNSYPEATPESIATTPFVQVAIGEGFACGLQASGTPICWGNDVQGVLSPPDEGFVLLAASSGYACGLREDEVTVCWGSNAPTGRPCPTACFGNGTITEIIDDYHHDHCRCQCPSIGQSCTCPVDRCKNGGRVQNDGTCSCECHNACEGTGCVRQADCSCRCAATEPHPELAALPDAGPNSVLYRIAGGGSTFPVERLPGKTIAGAAECSKSMLSLRLADTATWSGASCADSGSLFLGANMANLDINKHHMASVRFAGDMDGGWLYRVVKCEPANNTLLLCPRNWLIDSVHCLGSDRDCSQCLPRGRDSTSTAAYTSTCTKGPATAAASQLWSVILAGGYSGYYAEPSGSLNWQVPLPSGLTCATRFLMFRSQEWRLDNYEGNLFLFVKFHADGNGDYPYIYRGCNESTSSLLLEPYQWTISPDHCPNLDCSSCLPSSQQGDCLPSNMVPYGLTAAGGPDSSVTLSWSDPEAPAGTTYAVYIRSANIPPIRYTTSSRLLQVSLQGLGSQLQAKVVRVYCPITCPTGGCYPNSFAGSQLVRSQAEREECEGGVVDCMGVCNGTARMNPCGVCALPADYYKGEDYWVDCANTCGGSAYISECGICVGGRSGLAPHAHKDCQGTCFGNATRDECGVCHSESDHRSSRDCTGLCGGKAVVDECGQCALGTTKREFNADIDCAGQCFGKRLPTDPACQCERTHLDKCFVCGGDNTSCAGCDGVPNSGMVRDLCGVCGGDNTTCCFLPFAQATVVIRDFQAISLRSTLDAGETLLVQNLHEGRTYTVTLARLDDDGEALRPRIFPLLRPGNSLRIEISQPGKYRLTTLESSTVSTLFAVRYNTKTTDACGHCIDTGLLDDALPMHTAAYQHCCTVMESNNVHTWFATTHYSDGLALQGTTRVVQRSENYRSAPTRHHLRLVKPQMVDTSVWSAAGQKLAVGDMVVLENRDLLDHVIAITGPQPMPDVVLDRGTVAVAGPVLTPGTYRVESRSNLINTTFTVEFAFACTAHAHEQPEGYPWYHWVLGAS